MTLADRILSPARLTAPHYLAYKFVLGELASIKSGSRVLGFGARYSVLPALMSDAGFAVDVFDRDPKLATYQDGVANELGVTRTWNVIDLIPVYQYQAVVACWAIQHNFPISDQSELVVRLAQSIASRFGKLIIVSSYTPGASYESHNREDPQIILSHADHFVHIVSPACSVGFQCTKVDFFRYRHGTQEGGSCGADDANAICYAMTKV